MIRFFCNLQNPYHDESRWPWRDLWQDSLVITKNKTLDLCIDFYPCTLFHLNLETNFRGRDHAGPQIELGVLGLGVSIGLHDVRHWDYCNNKWKD